ncbi:MAG: divalent-cation tolerance protein CutA [Nitrospirae bacterium]|nr:MAG: divalent-cation tolerance protein CutA [Nitrospirota bacterium]
MSEIVVLVTAGSEDEARKLARSVVEKEIAACVTIIPHVRSLFRWGGQIAEEQECLLLVKTIDEAFESLERAIKSVHSYQVPEIIALPIQYGSREYLTWLKEMCRRHC